MARAKVGRPSKFTPTATARIIETVGVGVSLEVAAGYAGIDARTLRRWMERGRRQRKGEYRTFAAAVDQAEARAEVRVVAEWQKHVPKKWEACRDFLARRFPERWAETQKVQVQVEKEVEAMLAELQAVLAPEIYLQVLQGLAAAGRSTAPARPAGGKDGPARGAGGRAGGGEGGQSGGGAAPA